MNNYKNKTLDEFATRRNNENINNYNAGYEQALQDILEMIEADASYDEVYESIGEYLNEVFHDTKDINIEKPNATKYMVKHNRNWQEKYEKDKKQYDGRKRAEFLRNLKDNLKRQHSKETAYDSPSVAKKKEEPYRKQWSSAYRVSK